jgi:uncharacterized membrane protein
MKQWLIFASEHAIVFIDTLALVIIVAGSIEAFVRGMQVMLISRRGHERRDVWLRYARWLIAGLTFQLAADIIETSIRTDWESIAQLALIATIRTLLNFFLEKDLADMRERQRTE